MANYGPKLIDHNSKLRCMEIEPSNPKFIGLFLFFLVSLRKVALIFC